MERGRLVRANCIIHADEASALLASLSSHAARLDLHSLTAENCSPMSEIKFGTDGWRAVIAEEFTFTNVERVSQAAADYWSSNLATGASKNVVVGYDRRFLSDQFARSAAEVFSANGFEAVLTNQPECG